MEITVMMDNAKVIVDVEKEHAKSVFSRCVLNLLGENRVVNMKKTECACNESSKATKFMDEIFTYKGFLYIKCPSCGKIKAFCTKEEVRGFHCFDCNADVPFYQPLVPVYADCSCGRHFKYMTNIEDADFQIKCLSCGNEIKVVWNPKKRCYESENNSQV